MPRLSRPEAPDRHHGPPGGQAAAHDAEHRRRRQRRADDHGGSRGGRHLGQRGDAGGAERRLRHCAVPLPETPDAGAREEQLQEGVCHDPILALQAGLHGHDPLLLQPVQWVERHRGLLLVDPQRVQCALLLFPHCLFRLPRAGRVPEVRPREPPALRPRAEAAQLQLHHALRVDAERLRPLGRRLLHPPGGIRRHGKGGTRDLGHGHDERRGPDHQPPPGPRGEPLHLPLPLRPRGLDIPLLRMGAHPLEPLARPRLFRLLGGGRKGHVQPPLLPCPRRHLCRHDGSRRLLLLRSQDVLPQPYVRSPGAGQGVPQAD
mmetsp:Transcript_9554/g.24921  ORF Transcript_9554/g.24921 Transcript_9554/m.24921 type:complete len:318 (+) Transcript_9554:2475-3428(+)